MKSMTGCRITIESALVRLIARPRTQIQAASVTINDCWLENESSLYFSDIEVHQLALDYMFRFTETTS